MKINNSNFLIYFVMIHAIFTLGFGYLLHHLNTDSENQFSFYIGSLVAAFSVGTLVLIIKSYLFKNSVALPIGVIVFKYALIGFLIHSLSNVGLIKELHFVLGVFLLVFTFVATAVICHFQQEN